MNAIILSVGDELVLGQTVDTNSAWIDASLPLPLRERAGVRGNRTASPGELSRAKSAPSPPHPSPLPQGETEQRPTRVFVLPGVPKEMKIMFTRDVLPHIQQASGG